MSFQVLFELRSRVKLAIMLLWDLLALCLALLGAYWTRIGLDSWQFTQAEWLVLGANLVFTISVLTFWGHYRQIIRFIGLQALSIIIWSVCLSVLYLYAAKYALSAFVPVTVPLIYGLLATLLLLAPRLTIHAFAYAQNYKAREKCIIFGAADEGRALAQSLKAGNDLLPVAFIDDKRRYQGKELLGLPVGSRRDIPELAKKHGVSKVLLAVHNTSDDRRKELIAELEPFAIELLSIPNIQDIASGKRKIDELREIRIEELLGREPVPPILELLNMNLTGKRVMVTGAGGSIGSELCRQIALAKPSLLVLLELSEFNLYQIESELKAKHPALELVPMLASIQSTEALRKVMDDFHPQTIYHAAAYKHVPMIEANPLAGIRNNVFGTANVALAAMEYDVEKFVLVSTDKAVRPTNVMGATKRFAELFVQGVASLASNTEFALVRFGNVLGSSGSVVPLFDKQIRSGGPITVTHPDITRYFMTIPEAAQLVIQAGAMGKQGEVFVLDMGEPVKITDLAVKMAHLMGYSVANEGVEQSQGQIDLVFSGLRPGEKLYEELLIDDADTDTQHPRIMGADEIKLPFDEVVMLLDELNVLLINNDAVAARALLQRAPLAYTPATH